MEKDTGTILSRMMSTLMTNISRDEENEGLTEMCGDVIPKLELLKDYEETGLAPKQLKKIDCLYLEKCEEVNRLKENVEKAVERLGNYLFERYCIEGDSKISEIVKGGGEDET